MEKVRSAHSGEQVYCDGCGVLCEVQIALLAAAHRASVRRVCFAHGGEWVATLACGKRGPTRACGSRFVCVVFHWAERSPLFLRCAAITDTRARVAHVEVWDWRAGGGSGSRLGAVVISEARDQRARRVVFV